MNIPLLRPKIHTDVLRILGTPGSHFDVIQEGPFATVSKTWTTITDGVPQWIVVKSATTLRKFAREPHDIVKELRLLSSMTHANIAFVIGSFRDDEQNMLSIYMPYFPISLSGLLASPFFSPHPFPPLRVPDEEACAMYDDQFTTIARSIMLQTLAALAFLHDEQRRIGHRDIKPENIMLTNDGCIKLIDFGVSWNETELDLEKNHDLWPEYKGKLYFEVSTRAYRAPELLFGTRNYDHCAIDLWSIGATFAEFFTALRLVSDDEDDGDDDDDTEDDVDPEHVSLEPFIVPKYLRIGYPGAQWKRDTLFNGERGEIGLAWSIFKIFGTPTEDNWPDFEELPGATSVVFNVVPSIPLLPLFPNLPPSSMIHNPDPDPSPSSSISLSPALSSADPASQKSSSFPSSPFQIHPPSPSPSPYLTSPIPVSSSSSASSSSLPYAALPPSSPSPLPPIIDLLSRFLTYPSAARLRAEDAMRHPWFTAPGAVLLLPQGYVLDRNKGWFGRRERYEWKGRTLGEWVRGVLVGAGGASGSGSG